jgi:hypothetical protein
MALKIVGYAADFILQGAESRPVGGNSHAAVISIGRIQHTLVKENFGCSLVFGASCDRNVLSGQSLVDRDGKITSHLDPILVAIRPSSQLKAHRSGAKANNIGLRRWFFG